MKKLTLILLALCLLAGCAATPAETGAYTEAPAQTQPALQTLPPETTAAEIPDAPLGQAVYSVLENDNSVRNENGDVLVNVLYEQVILDTARPEWAGINALILEDYRSFLSENAWILDTSSQQWEQQLQSMGAVYGNFLCNRRCLVTYNADGIFSIRMMQEWFLGGVFNCDYYGLNFNLTTGEELRLAELSDLAEEEFLDRLKGHRLRRAGAVQ